MSDLSKVRYLFMAFLLAQTGIGVVLDWPAFLWPMFPFAAFFGAQIAWESNNDN